MSKNKKTYDIDSFSNKKTEKSIFQSSETIFHNTHISWRNWK